MWGGPVRIRDRHLIAKHLPQQFRFLAVAGSHCPVGSVQWWNCLLVCESQLLFDELPPQLVADTRAREFTASVSLPAPLCPLAGGNHLLAGVAMEVLVI